MRATAKLGQRYSFQVRVGDDTRCWTHKELDTGRDMFQSVLVGAISQE